MRGSKWIVGILCLGAAGILGATVPAVASLEYFYAKDGTITGRCVNGKIQHYSYDKKGQLTAVVDFATHEVVEQYVYDPAGNILRKTVNGRTTVYTYDKANQLVSSECNGKITKYEYDAAGRLVKEGKRSYSYSWLDKVSSVKENGVEVASFTYHMDGQIATAKANGRQENFLWDNLALISRNETEYVNEPYVTGGNPILADEDVLFNDLLGSTIGIRSGKEYRETGMTAFGETDEKSAMFTGKPYIGELGYAFLFRNYRPGLGKWLTCDPLGYPDGWNNFAYCNNELIRSFDPNGMYSFSFDVFGTRTFSIQYGSVSVFYNEDVVKSYTVVLPYNALLITTYPYEEETCLCCGETIVSEYEQQIGNSDHGGVPGYMYVFVEEQFFGEELERMIEEWTQTLKDRIHQVYLEWAREKVKKTIFHECGE